MVNQNRITPDINRDLTSKKASCYYSHSKTILLRTHHLLLQSMNRCSQKTKNTRPNDVMSSVHFHKSDHLKVFMI